MTAQQTLDDKIRQLQQMADNIAWNLGAGRKYKATSSRKFHCSLWDVTLNRGDLHVKSRGYSSLGKVSSKTKVTYKGRIVLDLDEEKGRTLYVPSNEWEEKLERLYYGK